MAYSLLAPHPANRDEPWGKGAPCVDQGHAEKQADDVKREQIHAELRGAC